MKIGRYSFHDLPSAGRVIALMMLCWYRAWANQERISAAGMPLDFAVSATKIASFSALSTGLPGFVAVPPAAEAGVIAGAGRITGAVGVAGAEVDAAVGAAAC